MIKRFTHKEFGKVVSWCYLYTVELPSRNLGVIEEVFTLEEHRKKGLATKLVKEAIDYARAIGCDCVELNVREGKEKFYEKMGFQDRHNKSLRLVL